MDQIKFDIEQLNENDAAEITKVFKKVFETYPFPVHDPKYIVKTMQRRRHALFWSSGQGRN